MLQTTLPLARLWLHKISGSGRRRRSVLTLDSRCHRPSHDLPVYDNTAKVGFGLWNYRDPEFALEIALLGLGIALYLARNVMPAIRKAAVIVFGIALVVIQIGDTYVPRAPLSDKAAALGVWIFYTLFVFIALLVERIGARPQTNAP